jgi:hypothetical protein
MIDQHSQNRITNRCTQAAVGALFTMEPFTGGWVNGSVRLIHNRRSVMQSFRIIVLAFIWVQTSAILCAGDFESRMEGVWFGSGVHPMSRTVLIVDAEKFTIVSPLGVYVSKYTIDDTSSLVAIDIDRFDGAKQLGVIEITDNELRLKLNDPNEPRPKLQDVRFPSGKPHWHTVFQRKATKDGLEVLSKHNVHTSEALQ